MTTQAEFIQANDINGPLTPEQAAQMMSLPEGDTSTALETGGEPGATAEDGTTTDDLAAGESVEKKPEVILAKDGVHTIPYEKLTEAREGERQWKAQAQALTEQIAALQADAAKRAEAGEAPTATDNATALAAAAIESGEVDPDIFGDFSEAALAKGVQTLVDKRVDARVNEAMAKIEQKLQPYEAVAAKSATEQHYSTIYERHPDADSIAESAELAAWIDSQPSFVRPGYKAILEKGTATEVVEFFDAFKQATGLTQTAKPGKTDLATAAQDAIAKAKAPVPASLTDFAGTTAGPGNKFEALAAMSGANLGEAMQSMTPTQIEQYLNRQL